MNNAAIITILICAVAFVFGGIFGFIIIGLCTMTKNIENEYERGITNRFNSCTDLISRSALLNELEKIKQVEGSDWIDLCAAENVILEPGDFKLISFGVSMRLPDGYEAIVVPRSSTFKNFGIIQTNSIGVIDQSYCGNDDVWKFPVYAARRTTTHIKKWAQENIGTEIIL